VNYFNQYGRVWQVYVQAEGEYRTRAENVGQFYVRNAAGQAVPLSTLVTMKPVNGPEFTTRFNEYRAAQISGSLAPGYSTRQGMRALEAVFAQTMSRDMGFDYSGISFQEKVAEQGIPPIAVFGFSLLVVFLLLAAQYESWTLPFGVLLGTPIAVLGAVGALWLGRLELDVFSQIGLVMVIGLAAKNAVLIVEFAKEEHEHGASLVDAALAGARVRLRPILMTAFAFILGVLPLVISTGAGANSRKILGATVLGGMLAATLVAIFIIPVTFYVSERFRRESKGVPQPNPVLAPISGGTDGEHSTEGRHP
jgi:HAE1 family hydrophobic/amphiphilic exporter-1